MYPQHAISHRDHKNSLYHMIQQCKPIAQVLEYDDFIRKHFIEKTGEAWISSDPAFTRMTSLLLTTTKFEHDKHHKKPNTGHAKHKPSKSFQKNKPKVAGSVFCFAFNGMSKNLATCMHSNCSYPHKCVHCKGPHLKSECDKIK